MYRDLEKICVGGNVYRNRSLKKLTTIQVGGKAKYVVEPILDRQVIQLVQYCRQRRVPFYILGAGSNVLADDDGFPGVIIHTTLLNRIVQHDRYLHVGAGALLSSIIGYATKEGLGGMEDAIGIPGTIGGAVIMNASAYLYETASVVRGVHVLRGNKVLYLRADACGFGYRTSCFTADDVILSVDLKLRKSDQETLRCRMLEVVQFRKRLPQEPSLGSVFKRQEGMIVSKLIDDLGFKGFSIGGAMVSPKHAGVIVNDSHAKSSDIKQIIQHIKETCKLTYGIDLQEEIRYLK